MVGLSYVFHTNQL